ncbi:Duplicated hybrid motif [Desulfitobacterium hafniense]|uniref:Duplicated hybrid motif n=1 Tax=Desulfitobacterium hafniense TaxID=49338 RepID=A0A098AUY5_DESHA|nr:YopX family protein [Desulfitobacterium hafniense]CDV96391.1 Duplicated hybrid motif [Desulfitobacterium hafniense]
MREIKFRAWVKEVRENGELQYGGHMVDTIHSLNFTKVTNLMTGVTPIGISCFVPGLFYGRVENLKLDEIELMQYAERHDKHGKEVYERDIVKALKHNETPFIREIVWRDGMFWFGNWNWAEFKNIFRELEVLGNAFEHPHLLEGVSQ